MTDDSIETTASNNSAPLISVVLPVYNGEKYLGEAIDSILAQTFTDFELIMIDDGSTDSSLQILRKYNQLDSRIRLVARENRGLATTLNELIDIARGEWVARMDQDDIALPQRFERQLEWLKQTGADISGSWVRRFGSSDKRLVRLRQTDEAIKMEMLFCSPFAHPSVMMRTALIKKLYYDKAWEKAEDYDLWERAAEAGWRMTNVPEVLLFYRVHAAQISTNTANIQQQQGQGIRQRYWEFVFHSMGLKRKSIEETLKLFVPPVPDIDIDIDMDIVDMSFRELLHNSHGESKKVIFEHATRLYFIVAANNSNVVSLWGKLNQEFGDEWGGIVKFKLLVFRVLRIRTDSFLFINLKKLYIWRASR